MLALKSKLRSRHHMKFEDPDHGWLKVEIADLEELGIASQMSEHSFMRGIYAYLEEDVDMSLYLKTIGIDSQEFYSKWSLEKVEHRWTNKKSKINGYYPFQNYTKEEKSEIKELKRKLLSLRAFNQKGENKIKNANLADLHYWAKYYKIKR